MVVSSPVLLRGNQGEKWSDEGSSREAGHGQLPNADLVPLRHFNKTRPTAMLPALSSTTEQKS